MEHTDEQRVWGEKRQLDSKGRAIKIITSIEWREEFRKYNALEKE